MINMVLFSKFVLFLILTYLNLMMIIICIKIHNMIHISKNITDFSHRKLYNKNMEIALTRRKAVDFGKIKIFGLKCIIIQV